MIIKGLAEKAIGSLSLDNWEMFDDSEKVEIGKVAAMMIEVRLLAAGGQDVTNAQRAIDAAMLNWTTLGSNRVTDEIVEILKKTLITAVSLALAAI